MAGSDQNSDHKIPWFYLLPKARNGLPMTSLFSYITNYLIFRWSPRRLQSQQKSNYTQVMVFRHACSQYSPALCLLSYLTPLNMTLSIPPQKSIRTSIHLFSKHKASTLCFQNTQPSLHVGPMSLLPNMHTATS